MSPRATLLASDIAHLAASPRLEARTADSRATHEFLRGFCAQASGFSTAKSARIAAPAAGKRRESMAANDLRGMCSADHGLYLVTVELLGEWLLCLGL